MAKAKNLKTAAKKVAAAGRKGDSKLIHVNNAEAPLVDAVLKAAGGSGTVNPATGLVEYGGGGGTINGKGGSGNVGGGGRGNAGGGGLGNTGKGEQSRVNDKPGTQQRSWGNRRETDYGAPIHTGSGPISGGIDVAQSEESWSKMNEQVDAYNAAADKWNRSAFEPSVNNLINNIEPFGLSMQAPELSKPKTYVGGDYHLGINPAAAIAGLAGGAVFPGAGVPAGAAAGAAYTALGGSNVMLGGGAVPEGWRSFDMGPNPNTKAPASNSTGSATAGKPTEGGGKQLGAASTSPKATASQGDTASGTAIGADAFDTTKEKQKFVSKGLPGKSPLKHNTLFSW